MFSPLMGGCVEEDLSSSSRRKRDNKSLANSLTIYFPAISYSHNQDRDPAIVDVADNPIIAYPILPVFAQNRATQSFTDTTRISKRRYPFVQKINDTTLCNAIELTQLF